MIFGNLFPPKRNLKFEYKFLDRKMAWHFSLSGVIIENAASQLEKMLQLMHQHPNSEVIFSLENITLMNSIGIHQWAVFLKRINPNQPICFENCSVEVVDHINLLPAFQGRATIRSFQIPYLCPSCTRHTVVLGRVAEIPKGTYPQPPPCTCGHTMELEQPEDEYFRFLDDE
jgi:anti-anti-sigma regulatory factor